MEEADKIYMGVAYTGRFWMIIQVQGVKVNFAMQVKQQRVKAEKLAKEIARKLRIPFYPWAETRYLEWNNYLPDPNMKWVEESETDDKRPQNDASEGLITRISQLFPPVFITPPSTPKPDETVISNCISGSIRAAGSGRWLADVMLDGKIRTIYVD